MEDDSGRGRRFAFGGPSPDARQVGGDGLDFSVNVSVRLWRENDSSGVSLSRGLAGGRSRPR